MSSSNKVLPDIKLTVFNSGWVKANKKVVVSGASSEELRMPATFAMIRHPEHGIILYDTGYSTRFYEATEKFPYSVMRKLTPAEITENDNADRQLEKAGVAAEEVKTIILGHGHVDHVPGIIYFPNAKVIIDRREWKAMQGSSLKLFSKGYIKSLYEGLDNDIEQLDMEARGKPYGPFNAAIDLWDDRSMILVSLPGHTVGQMGVIVSMPDGKGFFFIGDAAWVTENYLQLKPPSLLARTILASFDQFTNTLKLIRDFHEENPDVTIVPCHCPKVWDELKDMGVTG